MRIKGRTTAVLGTILLVLMALVFAPTSFASCSTGVEENEDVVEPTATSTSTPTSTPTHIPEPTQTPSPTAIPTPTSRIISYLDETADAGSTRVVVGGASDYVVGASFILSFGKVSQEQIKITALGFERRSNRGVHILTLSTPLAFQHLVGESLSADSGTMAPIKVPADPADTTRTPSTPQIPSGAVFYFDDSTSEDDRLTIKLGIEIAYSVFTDELGLSFGGVTIKTGKGGICQGGVGQLLHGATICLDTSHSIWVNQTKNRKLQTVAHEFFHVLQANAVGCMVGWDNPGFDLPWIGEGAADWFGYLVVSKSEIIPFDAALAKLKVDLAYSQTGKLMSTGSSPTPDGFSQRLATVGFDYLIASSDVHAYVEYCELRSQGVPYVMAFEQAFSTTLPMFYVQFELYRANGYK